MPLHVDIEGDPYLAGLVRKGEIAGMAKGRVEGEAAALVRLAERRFGPLSAAVRDRIKGAGSDQIEAWLDRLMEASDLETMFTERRAN